ncbi:hypothetical protein CANINC_001559 [Pichia inconspicua]|uniref:Uncharacterized protein n=1 Tax=Pichia inconspicua TaxID=52247 RepID=A0A4T0X3E1_9ASCO|nr:hypothetical protein CANINC_001559 [[Candida] inconspicua]
MHNFSEAVIRNQRCLHLKDKSMAKKSKFRGKRSLKKEVNNETNVKQSLLNSEEYIFDQETLALAGGDVELLHDIRRMIVGMDDNALKECVENLKNGGMPVDAVWDMIKDSVNTSDSGGKTTIGEDKRDGIVYDEEIRQESDDFEGKEFSIDLELPSTFFNPYKLHDALFKVLRICTFDTFDERIYELFCVIAVLCDPYTQPCDSGENNEMILSADLVSDLIIGIMYEEYIEIDNDGNIGNVPFFEMSFDLARIIEKISIVLNVDDENILMNVKNDEKNWESELFKWLPQNTFSNMNNIASDYHHMMLLYTIITVSLLTISKLYNSNENICLNPFLSLYLQLWKNFSKVLLLGIEIDCRDEENGFLGYPEVIKFVIKGSSAVRSMISLILNNEFKRRIHDLKHESLINFMRPWGRKFSNGSIKVDMRVFVAALVSLGMELDNVSELLFGFIPEDRYDEDVKYMFEMELEDMEGEEGEGEECDDDDDDERKRYVGDNVIVEIEREGEGGEDEGEKGVSGKDMEEKVMSSGMYDLHPDCRCEFEDFESDVEYDEGEEEEGEEETEDIEIINQLGEIAASEGLSLDILRKINNGPSALRYQHMRNGLNSGGDDDDKPIVDSKGRDWRDIPRGENRRLNDKFVKLLRESVNDSNIFITDINELINEMKKMSEGQINEELGEKIVRSIAWVVQYERESMMMNEEERKKVSDDSINTDVIYNFIRKEEDRFIEMIKFNPNITFSIIDELLMSEGYRRVLIWFLTHLPLNQWIINYIHELIIGERGERGERSGKGERIEFSRIGKIELSEIEIKMLLHEFFSNSVIFLSQNDLNGRIENEKIVKIICLMIKSLEKNGILKPESEDCDEYRVEIQTLLIQWVGITSIPEARELFFKYGKRGGGGEGKSSNHNNYGSKRVHNIFQALKNFDSITIFMISLNIAIQINNNNDDDDNEEEENNTKKSQCFEFLNNLNLISGIYKDNLEFENDCLKLFKELKDGILSKDIERIIQISKENGILIDTDAEEEKRAREVVAEFIRGEETTTENVGQS